MKLSDMIEEMRKIFVPQDTFDLRITPLERIIYGGVSVILLAVLTAIVALVIRKAQ